MEGTGTYIRFLLRRQFAGDSWSVIDMFSDLPAEIDGLILCGMDKCVAEEMAHLMNTLDQKRRSRH